MFDRGANIDLFGAVCLNLGFNEAFQQTIKSGVHSGSVLRLAIIVF
jgi:hypothetical protein